MRLAILAAGAAILSWMLGVSADASNSLTRPAPADLAISNDTIRVRFHRPGPGRFGIFPQGYTGYTVDLKSGSDWVSMARAPFFSAFSYRSGWGRDWLGHIIPGSGEVKSENGVSKAVFTDVRWDFDSVKWTFTFEFSVKPGEDWVDVKYTAVPERQSKLLLFWGPRLYAGDGSFGDSKDEALFAGLDWLGPKDRSSANPALAPDARLWFAPTPAKVTIPLMCVVHKGKMVGLMWDPMQKWYGEQTCPSAVFASPNWIEGKANHLLGLYVPSIPRFAAENTLRAHTPAVIEAGQPVSLSCRILACAGSHVTDAVDVYLRSCGGLPKPVRKPMDYAAALNTFVRALTGPCWDEKAGGWPWEYGGGAEKAPWLQTSLLLAEAASLVDDPVLSRAADELGRRVVRSHTERPIQMGLRVGGLPAGIEWEAGLAADRIKRQAKDGSWPFESNRIEEGGLLGLSGPPEPGYITPEGYKSQGITAAETAALLGYVRITGDENAWRAALKGLRHLETYSIPSVYRTYECPQSPSLHGSYSAARANLIAYEITGDRKYLDRAVYWAKTGLPFIYLWSLPAQEVKSGYIHCAQKIYLTGDQLYKDTTRDAMLYGGLYGYGSSQYTHHWNGILVHWIPLVYARDLAELARYDRSLPWERIVHGILTSALWQTFDQPPYAGYLPDAFSLDTWVPSGPAFSPGLILQALMPIVYGRHADPRTVIVREGSLRCHVTSSVQPQDVCLNSGSLSFTVRDETWPSTRVIVAGIKQAVGVIADGKPLPKVKDLESAEECWSDGPASTILIRVGSGSAPRKLRVEYK